MASCRRRRVAHECWNPRKQFLRHPAPELDARIRVEGLKQSVLRRDHRNLPPGVGIRDDGGRLRTRIAERVLRRNPREHIVRGLGIGRTEAEQRAIDAGVPRNQSIARIQQACARDIREETPRIGGRQAARCAATEEVCIRHVAPQASGIRARQSACGIHRRRAIAIHDGRRLERSRRRPQRVSQEIACPALAGAWSRQAKNDAGLTVARIERYDSSSRQLRIRGNGRIALECRRHEVDECQRIGGRRHVTRKRGRHRRNPRGRCRLDARQVVAQVRGSKPGREWTQAVAIAAARFRQEMRQRLRGAGCLVVAAGLASGQEAERNRSAGVFDRRPVGAGCRRIRRGRIRASVHSESARQACQPARGFRECLGKRRSARRRRRRQ